MNIVHELFCADSRGVLTYTQLDPPPLGRREMSLMLIHAMNHHAGLDWFESADVFDRVAQMRPAPPDADVTRAAHLAAQTRSLLAMPVATQPALLAPGGLPNDLITWLKAFTTAGQQLREAADGARLDRGLRAILAHIVIFHWNRLGLAARTQAILARAAATATLPRS
jgi:thiopeptide-type bacteriocin biosynthesis protein